MAPDAADHHAILDAARAYLARGWCVVPIRTRTKRPTLDRWQELRLAEDDLEAHFPPGAGSNIGLILGAPSQGLVDVDLDCPEARELADSFLPHTDAISGRPSAPGSHRWFIAEGAAFVRHSFADRSPIVELRATGGQTVVWPSVHPSGELYGPMQGEPARVDAEELARAVAALAEACRAMRGEAPPQPKPEPARNASRSEPKPHGDVEARAIAYLAALPPSISGAGGHACAYRAATALVHGFALEPDHALTLLERHFNPRCQPPWSPKELQHKVADAASKGHANPRGYLRDAERAAQQLAHTADLSGIMAQANAPRPAPQPEETADAADPADPGPFPQHLLSVPGLVGQVMAYDLATAHKPQPILALAGAIALQAVLAGRKVRDARGNRTNLQVVGVAQSGAGKDNARKTVKRVLHEAGLSELEGNEDLASDSALVSALVISPAAVFLFDEFGRFLRTAADPRKNPHLFNIVTTLIKLYSSADVMFKAKGYADAKQNKVVDQPCCVVYGTSVPSHFLGSLTVESLSDGFVGRLLVFEAEDQGIRRWADAAPVPEPILVAARWWGAFKPGGNLAHIATARAEPLLVPTTPEAAAIFQELAERVDAQPDGLGRSIWARAEQKACQLALVYACSACAEAPVIDAPAAAWACELATYLTRRLIWLAHTWVADSEFDRRQKDVMRMVRAAGGRMTRSELTRSLQRITSRERADILTNLVETNQLAVIEEPTATQPRLVYVVR
jgi:hypothetical protein